MDHKFVSRIYQTHQECTKCAPSATIHVFFEQLLGILFPNFASTPVASKGELEKRLGESKELLKQILFKNYSNSIEEGMVIDNFYTNLPTIYEQLQKDIEATFQGDPAAKSEDEIIRAYPGFYAIAAYRIAHQLLEQKFLNIPRLITEFAHSKTGIDIHPGAKIGEYFCIDHGTGIVIGETTIIGKYVKIYQGVTLGALSVKKEDAKLKRHPTIEDHVVLYAGASILGGKTTIGHHSIIGGNVWLTSSVPAYSKIYYKAHMHNDIDNTTDTIIYK